MVKLYALCLMLVGMLGQAFGQVGQAFDFKNTNYYLASANTLLVRDTNLTAFSYDNADTATHPLFVDGLYFPVQDFLNQNLWLRLRHIAHDPNGRNVGWNVPRTGSNPFTNGLGGWQGFLYQIDILADANLTGARANRLNGPFLNNITVESLETLSANEWLVFEILNPESAGWSLDTVSFTGRNPGSDPHFSDTARFYRDITNPPTDYTPVFPNGRRRVAIEDGPAGGFSEFRMSANNVSSFRYGYEYNISFGYQGMDLKFGLQAVTGTHSQSGKGSLMAYPNPAGEVLKVQYAAAAQPGRLYLVDGLGRTIELEAVPAPSGIVQVSLAQVPPGIYQLVLEAGAKRQTTRIFRR